MHDYNRNHYSFVRQTELRRSDFEEPPSQTGDRVVFWAAVLILLALVLL